VGILHLNVFMAHKSPGRQEIAVESQGTAEIHHGLLMLGFQRIVVAHDAASFGSEFVGGGRNLSHKGKPRPLIHDIQDVGVVVEAVKAMW